MKLRTRLMLFTSAISAIFAFAIIHDRVRVAREAMLQRAQDRVDYMGAVISEVVARNLEDGTHRNISDMLRAFEHFRQIAYIRVTDNSGKVLYRHAQTGLKIGERDPHKDIFEAKGHIYSSATEITAHGENVARLEMGLWIREIHEAVENLMWRGIAFSVLFIFMIVAMVWWLTRRLGRDLGLLADMADKLDGGLPPDPAAFTKGTDTGKIATALSGLSRRLAQEERRRLAAETEKDDFYAMTVHDLKQPVTALKASLDLLLSEEESRNFTQEQLRALTKVARSSLNMLTSMIADVLNTAKLRAPGYQIEKERVPVADFLRSCAEENATAARAARKTWEFSLPQEAEGLWMFADRDLVRRAIGNLVLNAIQYTPEGGKIRLGLRLAGEDKAAIYVSDEGEGIPENFREEIFKKYSTLGKTSGNIGLGLAFCRLAAEKHSATLDVRSAPGKGTEISFVIPVSRERAPQHG